jgi:hypothetical protein
MSAVAFTRSRLTAPYFSKSSPLVHWAPSWRTVVSAVGEGRAPFRGRSLSRILPVRTSAATFAPSRLAWLSVIFSDPALWEARPGPTITPRVARPCPTRCSPFCRSCPRPPHQPVMRKPPKFSDGHGYALFLCVDFFSFSRGISVGRSWDAESASSDLGSVRAPDSRVKRSELSETPSADATRESCA